MSSVGRGRGYTGRHSTPRPGDAADAAPRAMPLSPRATDSREREKRDLDLEKEEDRDIMENLEAISSEDDAALKDLLFIDEQYQPLLALLEQFSPSEDGIQFNRKLRHFETTITNMCPDETRLQQAFATFRAAALLNPVTARKLAGVGASFTRQQRQQLLRTALLNVIMQGTYSKLDILERANPLFLINAANLMGDYFAEARLCNGNKVHILASPLVHYMKALLASDDIRAHRSLATQLMQNGRELLSVLSQELDELTIAIRLRILSPPPCGIIWLLLSSDMCLNKFLPLPNSLQQFYAAHLKLTSDDSYSEVSYGSWKKSPEKEDKSDSDIHNISNISLSDNDESKPKLRPILGAGAGLLRQEQTVSATQDSFEMWNSQKTSLTKRYDLNSWRQEEEKKDDQTPVYDPTVLPPNFTDYPPPRFNPNFQESFNNYLQQGDGAYIQSFSFNQEGGSYFPERQERGEQDSNQQDVKTVVPEQSSKPERVNNEVQKTGNRKPIENWRKEKAELNEDSNIKSNWTHQRSRDNVSNDEPNWTQKKSRENLPNDEANWAQKKSRENLSNEEPNWTQKQSRENLPNDEPNWNRQRSRDNLSSEEEKDKRSLSRNSRDSRVRMNRRHSGENSESGMKTPPRRHVSDVPRSQKYWDHDDRCDKDYNS